MTVHPEVQSARSLCRLETRLISMTATQDGGQLAFSSRLRTVAAGSRWDVHVSVDSADASEGLGASVQASRHGIVHVAVDFEYVAERQISIGYTGRLGHGCRMRVGVHQLA
jgi:hypothetical protein